MKVRMGRIIMQHTIVAVRACMKITPQHHSVNPADELLLCSDVSKSTLNFFSQYACHGRAFRIKDEIPNTTAAIEHVLTRAAGVAEEAGLSAVRVLAESTGGFRRKLLGLLTEGDVKTASIKSKSTSWAGPSSLSRQRS